MKLFFATLSIALCQQTLATTWLVGPNRMYKYCSEIATLVQDGDTIKIDYATYVNDPQVTWSKNNLYIIGVGGRPRLQAGSKIATNSTNGKGIFVITGSNVRVENIEFTNAAVLDHNGAGIRQEGANLFVHRCKFDGNEMGILSGNIANCKTTVEFCEFINGGSIANPGYQHNIYINHIDTLIFRYNYSYNAIAQGHEFKSRANYNFILYNTIANYETVDSRNIDLPNGGTSILMGNVLEQGQNSANSNIVGYGKEGLTNNSEHNLWIVNNTFINKKTTGSFIDIGSGTNILFLKNNIMSGAKTGGLIIGTAQSLDSSNNIISENIANCGFISETNFDYRLLSTSVAVDAGIALTNSVAGNILVPQKMYDDTCNVENRNIVNAIDIGAFEYNNAAIIDKLTTTPPLSIYPNPASNFVTIDAPLMHNTATLHIYNAFGSLIKEAVITHKTVVEISHIPQGLYFIRINNNPLQTFKLIKN